MQEASALRELAGNVAPVSQTRPPVREPNAGNKVSWDIFWCGPDGFGEHLQVVADDSQPIIRGRTQLIEWLKSIGAKPQPRDIPYPGKTSPKAPADPMYAAAQQVLGAAVGKNCQIHNVAMRRIPGGVSQKTGKPYNAFWVCDAVDGCRGE